MTYGYCRISTKQQSIERQIRNITAAYPEARIYPEAYTGTKIDRPQWSRLYKTVQAGDMIVFDSVSRMSRDAEEGYKVYQELFNKGITLVFLKEPHINTDTYRQTLENQLNIEVKSGDAAADQLMQSIIGALNQYVLELARRQIQLAFEQAEKEVDDLRQRTREGIETARLNGKPIGQPKGSKYNVKKSGKAMEIIRRLSRDFGGNLNDKECMCIANISKNTFYKYKAIIKAEDLKQS